MITAKLGGSTVISPICVIILNGLSPKMIPAFGEDLHTVLYEVDLLDYFGLEPFWSVDHWKCASVTQISQSIENQSAEN